MIKSLNSRTGWANFAIHLNWLLLIQLCHWLRLDLPSRRRIRKRQYAAENLQKPVMHRIRSNRKSFKRRRISALRKRNLTSMQNLLNEIKFLAEFSFKRVGRRMPLMCSDNHVNKSIRWISYRVFFAGFFQDQMQFSFLKNERQFATPSAWKGHGFIIRTRLRLNSNHKSLRHVENPALNLVKDCENQINGA